MIKTLVLGATGFIGGHIVRAALETGWVVRGFRRDPKSTGHVGDANVEWFFGNLMDLESLHTAMESVEVVFHAAAYYPRGGNLQKVSAQVEYAKQEINNVLTATKKQGVQRLIYTSSLTTIGHPPIVENRLADERDYYIPGTLAKSGYYEAKIAMESAVFNAIEEGLSGVVLNPTAVFGPGDVHLTMGNLLIAVAKGWVIAWLPAMINVVDVRDVAKAHIAAANNRSIGERYIIGGHNMSIREALTMVADVANSNPPRLEIPLWFIRALVLLNDLFPFIPLSSNHLRAVHLWQGYNINKAQRELNLNPRPFMITISDALSWFQEEGML